MHVRGNHIATLRHWELITETACSLRTLLNTAGRAGTAQGSNLPWEMNPPCHLYAFSIAALTNHYKLSSLKQHSLSHSSVSQKYRRLCWALCLECYKSEIRCWWAGLLSKGSGEESTLQAYADCWQNLLPCSCRPRWPPFCHKTAESWEKHQGTKVMEAIWQMLPTHHPRPRPIYSYNFQ